MNQRKEFYRRNLPHFQPPGATIFLTWRLANSLPLSVLRTLMDERQRMLLEVEQLNAAQRAVRLYEVERLVFARIDHALATQSNGPFWLADPAIARAVADTFCDDHGMYSLEAFSIMANHAHVVLTPACSPEGDYYPLSRITQSLKGRSALEANRVLGRTGPFWQQESYDHVVRNDAELERVIKYVLWNPVKAGLVGDWRDWKWSYCRFVPEGM